MKKLLFFSSFCFLFACHTSEESVNANKNNPTDTLVAEDSANVNTVIINDTIRAINHGSPEQEKLDSIKRAKQEKKEKK